MSDSTNHISENPEATTNWSELDVRSEEVQEIIGRPPHWLVRWGIIGFFGVLGLVVLSAALIRYPDVIQAPIRLTAIQAPKALNTRISGKVDRILAENNSHVEKGEVLAWMESTANHEEVIRLSAKLDSIRTWLLNQSLDRFHSLDQVLLEFRNLGELQASFQSFEQAYREFRSYLPGGFHGRRQRVLKKELDYKRQLLKNLYEQKQIQKRDFESAEREYQIQQQLAEKNFLAPIELARAERELSSRRMPLQQTESAIINNQLSQAAKEQEILELESRMKEQRSVFLQAVNSMGSNIDEWKQTHLLIAPYAGNVLYAGVIQENQTMSAGQEVFYIHSGNAQFFGELTVSQQSFGKIEEGQQVQIRFSGYPYHEFGSIYGEVEYFSEIPVKDSLFFAKVRFPRGLVTSYGRDIPPRNGMTGRAEIIAKDMNLLNRVANNIIAGIE